jgi:hypothetical protein
LKKLVNWKMKGDMEWYAGVIQKLKGGFKLIFLEG